MTDKPFMPKATAVWLVENTKISFKQIAAFCALHELEVKGIADGDVAKDVSERTHGCPRILHKDRSQRWCRTHQDLRITPKTNMPRQKLN